MKVLVEDTWINDQATSSNLSELADCSIAIDATYWLSQLLDSSAANEPLLPALGGLTGIETHIEEALDHWEENAIIPFFIFDGQSLTGQDEVTLKRALAANQRTDEAWDLYSQGEAERAVKSFGDSPGAYRVQNLYSLLKDILNRRGLHFLVAPYNACAQLAYFEMIDSDQCAGVMGPQELLAYPIRDAIIRSFNWEAKTVSAISKRRIMRTLAVGESMLIDALLMRGTVFLSPFPPLQEKSMYPSSPTIMDVVNLLRTSDKSVANACASFSDILKQSQEPEWLDKYRKARLAVQHFIHITETGEIGVNDYDHLTQDNHEYLGLQIPPELFHYLNTGLIEGRILNCITHGQILLQPTLDGVASDEYKKLVTTKIIPIKEQTLGLMIPRVHRGIGHKAITLRVWYDPKFSYKMNHGSLNPPPSQKVGSWDVKEEDIRAFYPADFAGPVAMEVLSLVNTDFVPKTVASSKSIKGIDSTEMVTSVAIWRFLHLRGYVDDSHRLTTWGTAIAATFLAFSESMEGLSPVSGIDEAALLAFELVKLGVLDGRAARSQPGYPRNGSDQDKAALSLISQCATLLKLRHEAYGYTGPLNKSLLSFRSLSSTVREAGRDLVEAIVASMFLFGQSQRQRSDHVEITFRTFFDDDVATDNTEARAERLREFPKTFVPHAEALEEDFRACVGFFSALNKGIQVLDNSELSAANKEVWARAQAYLDARPF
ncbi:XPG N-terminal domain [Geosmithia morbida]|uniref:XPG N-terminal domain n=1 Tax=Geosmithia morbida TaxID=1094350 RepID=A0A9P4YRE5_9HYPO|nr:XPG N-terminal domain [Geosmithia morbida]KAF4120442.1 XPG N-terminal domain [Geosmithia morbida]